MGWAADIPWCCSSGVSLHQHGLQSLRAVCYSMGSSTGGHPLRGPPSGMAYLCVPNRVPFPDSPLFSSKRASSSISSCASPLLPLSVSSGVSLCSPALHLAAPQELHHALPWLAAAPAQRVAVLPVRTGRDRPGTVCGVLPHNTLQPLWPEPHCLCPTQPQNPVRPGFELL